MGYASMASLISTGSTTSRSVAGANGGLLKVDTRGRVRTSLERRQAILEEFDQSGVSAAQFAKLAGIRYSTFAAWVNRRHSRLKILLFDDSGLWVCTKRLEQGTFRWPRSGDPATTKLRLTPEALAWLTDGVDLRGAQLRLWSERPT